MDQRRQLEHSIEESQLQPYLETFRSALRSKSRVLERSALPIAATLKRGTSMCWCGPARMRSR